MPKYHVVVGAYAMPDGGATVLSSTRPGHAATHVWEKPIGAFQWPMDAMTRHPGNQPMDYKMFAILQAPGVTIDEENEDATMAQPGMPIDEKDATIEDKADKHNSDNAMDGNVDQGGCAYTRNNYR